MTINISHKASYYTLPHPVRINVDQNMKMMIHALAKQKEKYQRLKEVTYTMSEVFFHEFMSAQSDSFFATDDEISSELVYPKFIMQNGAIFTNTDTLNSQLLLSDCPNDILAASLQLPYSACYFEFGHARDNILEVFNEETNWHVLEGAYIFEVKKAHNFERILEIVLIGSPVGKTHLLDDALETFKLFIDDENKSLNKLLEDAFRTMFVKSSSIKYMTQRRIIAIENSIRHLVKTILYVHSCNAIKRNCFALNDSVIKSGNLGQKKQAREKNKQKILYDKIILGPENNLETFIRRPFDAAKNAKSPHWRRGHFRRMNEGIITRYISPTLVRKDLLNDNNLILSKKDYITTD